MKCYARWEKDDNAGVFFRDQTILQFGNSWELLANLVLLNPGSALPINHESKTDYLSSMSLPFFVEPKANEQYVEFSVDPLMKNILKLFSDHYDGGTIRLYNLFNLKNQNSGEAVSQFKENMNHPKIFSLNSEIKFCDAPVIIASGSNAHEPELKKQLINHIRLAPKEKIYVLDKDEHQKFTFKRTVPDSLGFIDSYHPSYTFNYGNSTSIGEFLP